MTTSDRDGRHPWASPSVHAHVAAARPAVPWKRDTETGDQFVNVAEVSGPCWWRILHSWAEAIREEGCSSCGEFAVGATVALHDLVNVELGKPVWDRRNFVDFAAAYHAAAEEVLGMHVDKPAMGRAIIPSTISARIKAASALLEQAAEQATAARPQALQDEAIAVDVSGEGDFVSERLADPDEFDPRSLRTVSQGDHRIVIGCAPKEWDSGRQLCRAGTRAQSVLHPRGEEQELIDEARKRGLPIFQQDDPLLEHLEEEIQRAWGI